MLNNFSKAVAEIWKLQQNNNYAVGLMSNAKISQRRSRCHGGFEFWHGDFHRKTSGFTMVEVVVMMTIMVTISGMVLVSFTGLHEGSALNRASRELALAIRKVQNTSLAVTQVNTNSGPKIPSAVGIRLVQGASAYILFADLTRDNKYDTSVISDDPDARIGDDQVLERGVKIKSLAYLDALNEPQAIAVAHIIFVAPEAAVFIGDQEGNALGEILKIELTVASGNLTKTVTMRTSGQVSIR